MNFIHICTLIFTFVVPLSLSSQFKDFIPQFCSLTLYHDIQTIRLDSNGNRSSIVLNAHLYEGLKFDPSKGLKCQVMIKAPKNIGIITTVRKILIKSNDSLSFRSGSNAPKEWDGNVNKIDDEIVVQPNTYGDSDMYISFKTHEVVSEHNAGFQIAFTAFTAKKDECDNESFDCENERCVWSGLQCNQYNNCGNHKDEDGCNSDISIWLIVLLVIICIVVVALSMFVWYRMAQK